MQHWLKVLSSVELFCALAGLIRALLASFRVLDFSGCIIAYDLVDTWRKLNKGDVVKMLNSIHSILPERVKAPLNLPDEPTASQVSNWTLFPSPSPQ